MKNFFWTLMLMIMSSTVIIAQQDIEITEEKTDKNIILSAVNNTNEPLEITFNLNHQGVDLDKPLPIVMTIAPKSPTKLITLTIRPNESYSYETSLSYKKPRKLVEVKANDMKASAKTTSIQMNTNKVNVFTQNGCGRCSFVIKYLEENKIPYVELNTSAHAPNGDLMWAELEKGGFKGGNVTMPVIYNNGKIHYSIADLQKFVAELK
jgi:glutaredoxin